MNYKVVYTDKTVIQILENVENSIAFYPSYLNVLVDTLEGAYSSILSKGVNCSLIEEQLGIDPEMMLGMHDQQISAMPSDLTVARRVDLQIMHVIPLEKRFRLVWKVKHYRINEESGVLEYIGNEIKDTIKVLIADNTTIIGGMGEYDFFMALMKAGADMFDLFTQNVMLRDSEGRFN